MKKRTTANLFPKHFPHCVLACFKCFYSLFFVCQTKTFCKRKVPYLHVFWVKGKEPYFSYYRSILHLSPNFFPIYIKEPWTQIVNTTLFFFFGKKEDYFVEINFHGDKTLRVVETLNVSVFIWENRTSFAGIYVFWFCQKFNFYILI